MKLSVGVLLACVFLASAPAAQAQSYWGSWRNGDVTAGSEGGYNQALGTSQKGIPPMAQAQARAAPESSVYEQWDYTGWSGLTQRSDNRMRLNEYWSAQSGPYVQANPPLR